MPIPTSDLIKGSNASAITDTAATTIIAAPGAGLVNCITDIMVTNASTTTASVVTIASGATTLWKGYARAEGGFSVPLGIELVGEVNTAVTAQCATTGTSMHVSMSGFKRRA